MTLLFVIAGLVLATLFAAGLALTLGKAAAAGDRQDLERMASAAGGAGLDLASRRTGPADRRAARRPWAGVSPGRRREDVLRQELADAEQQVSEARARLG